MIEKTEVLKFISEAFADVPRPDDKTLLHSACYDDMDLQSFYGGTYASWRDIPDETIAYENAALCFVSPVGFQHLIPAYMSWTLNNLANLSSASAEATIYALNPRGELESFQISKYELLDLNQKKSIVAFLDYLKRHGQDLIDIEAVELARTFWLKEIEQSAS